jgi:hypothetical protein
MGYCAALTRARGELWRVGDTNDVQARITGAQSGETLPFSFLFLTPHLICMFQMM